MLHALIRSNNFLNINKAGLLDKSTDTIKYVANIANTFNMSSIRCVICKYVREDT